MKRRLFRQSDGRFRQGSLEKDFGIRVAVCSECNGCNPYTRCEPVEVNGFIDPFSMNKWDRPTTCGHCGKELPKED